MNLTKEHDLADEWNLSHEQFRILRRRHGWAHVKFSRQDIRYTDEQIEQIVRDMTQRPIKAAPAGGLTARSARRSA